MRPEGEIRIYEAADPRAVVQVLTQAGIAMRSASVISAPWASISSIISGSAMACAMTVTIIRMVEQITAGELKQKCTDYLHLRSDQPQKAAAVLEQTLKITRWEMRPEGEIPAQQGQTDAQPLLHAHGVAANRLFLPGRQAHQLQNFFRLPLRAVQGGHLRLHRSKRRGQVHHPQAPVRAGPAHPSQSKGKESAKFTRPA